MKFLVIFVAAFACTHAVNLPYIISNSGDSSEEEYRVIVPANGQTTLSLAGVGVVNPPAVEAVKVKVPRLVSPEVKQQIIKQTLTARGYGSILTDASATAAPRA